MSLKSLYSHREMNISLFLYCLWQNKLNWNCVFCRESWRCDTHHCLGAIWKERPADRTCSLKRSNEKSFHMCRLLIVAAAPELHASTTCNTGITPSARTSHSIWGGCGANPGDTDSRKVLNSKTQTAVQEVEHKRCLSNSKEVPHADVWSELAFRCPFP